MQDAYAVTGTCGNAAVQPWAARYLLVVNEALLVDRDLLEHNIDRLLFALFDEAYQTQIRLVLFAGAL